MAVFTTEHTARKPHQCGRCDRPIKPGQRYAAYAITPNDTDFGNAKWLRGRRKTPPWKPSRSETLVPRFPDADPANPGCTRLLLAALALLALLALLAGCGVHGRPRPQPVPGISAVARG